MDAPTAARCPPTVVLVDDDARFRELARELLQGDGYEIVGEAGTAVGGVCLARELRPDAVVLDLIMPEVDDEEITQVRTDDVLIDLVSAEHSGLRAAAELVGDEPGYAVVVTSSLIDPLVEQRARRLGATYIDKVSGVDALERAIDSRIRQRQQVPR
jgi:DNA-binding NarL/FixJ family response regulator